MPRCQRGSTKRRSLISFLALSVLAAGCGGAETVRTGTSGTAATTTVAVAPTTTDAAVLPAPAAAPTTATAPPSPSTEVQPPATTAAPQPAAAASPPADTAVEAVVVPSEDAETIEPVPASDLTERVAAVLADRSFREFDPSRDAEVRKAVILDFFSGIELWAQYAEGDRALVEWQIRADSYRVEGDPDGSEVTLYFIEPRGSQILPAECATCVDTKNVSISLMNVFDSERIAFKVNDPYSVLQSPFPVFNSWTRFSEDEYVD